MPSPNTDVQTILFLAAIPQETGRKRLDQELRDIAEGLRRAQKRDQFKLEQRSAVRSRDIHRAVLDVNPQIIHFSGQGEGAAGLMFEDDQGNARWVDGVALAGLFKLFADQITCVVLNGCYSDVQAKAIAQHIPYVIGMNQAINDLAAIEFAVGFYDALGAGRDVEFAYNLGCNAIQRAGLQDYLTPVLLTGTSRSDGISGDLSGLLALDTLLNSLSTNFPDFISELEISQLCQLLISHSSFHSSDSEARKQLLIKTKIWEYCNSLDLNGNLPNFIIDLCTTLVESNVSTEQTSGQVGLIIFLENLDQVDPHLTPDQRSFIRGLISRYNQWREARAGHCQAEDISNTSDVDWIDEQAFINLVRQLRKELQDISISVAYTANFNDILNKVLRPITFKTGELLCADRTTIFFLNEAQELSSIVAQADDHSSIEIRVSVGKGFSGRVAEQKKALRISRINLDHPDASETKKQFERTGYRTYNLLTMPVLNEQNSLIAVIQLVNKLQPLYDPAAPLVERVDEEGFTKHDEKKLAKFVNRIQLILEEFQSYYKIAQRIQEIVGFTKAMQSLSLSKDDLEETRHLIVNVAREFMDADRTTLWLLDAKKNQLYAEIQASDGSVAEQRVAVGQGYVGKAAQSKEFLNIPFDLYEIDPEGSQTARLFDQKNRYRTCSLLCMPIVDVEDNLLGVLQLVNKKKRGNFPEYDPDTYPQAPERFEASFTKADEDRLSSLRSQVATAIQEAKRSVTIKRDDHLYNMLCEITQIARDGLRADRATIFLVDEGNQELWSIIADSEGHQPLEIRLSVGQGIAGEVAHTKIPLVVSDFYNDPRSEIAKQQDQETGYRTYNVLALPLVDDQDHLVAVVEFLNKLKPTFNSRADLSQRVDPKGFSPDLSPRIFDEYAPVILQLLKGFRDLHALTRRQQRISSLNVALRSINQRSANPGEILKRVIQHAKDLVNADRSTLWLFDRENNDLWTEIPDSDGVLKEQRVDMGKGYVGRTAASRDFLNVPFDLYDDEQGSQVAKQIDQQTGYRTCSLLCIPISNFYGELIGVIQLVNKQREGKFPEYDPSTWPQPPECFRASFDEEDCRLLQVFNSSAGNNLYLVELYQSLNRETQEMKSLLDGTSPD